MDCLANLSNGKSSRKAASQSTGKRSTIEVPDNIRESIMKSIVQDAKSDPSELETVERENGSSEMSSNIDRQAETESNVECSKKTVVPNAASKSTVKQPEISSEFEELPDDDGELDTSSCQSTNDKKVRVRTAISEDVLTVLKMHFQCNPKPNRDEIVELSNKLNHPQRVLQVWFQNMR